MLPAAPAAAAGETTPRTAGENNLKPEGVAPAVDPLSISSSCRSKMNERSAIISPGLIYA